LLSLVSFYFVFISLISSRFVSFLFISFRFVSFRFVFVDFASFRFVLFGPIDLALSLFYMCSCVYPLFINKIISSIWICVILNNCKLDKMIKVSGGTYKVRNEIETKRNETKRNQRKRSETKRNETKSTKTKRNETKSTK
jgi:hypothetical protein